MLNSQERLHQSIAAARAANSTVKDTSLNALGSKCVPCPMCDGTGLPENTHFRNIEFCKNCNGRGYVSVAVPKPVRHADAFDFRKHDKAS